MADENRESKKTFSPGKTTIGRRKSYD